MILCGLNIGKVKISKAWETEGRDALDEKFDRAIAELIQMKFILRTSTPQFLEMNRDAFKDFLEN